MYNKSFLLTGCCSVIIIFFSFFASVMFTETIQAAYILGDLNNDSRIDSNDYILLRRYILGIINDSSMENNINQETADLNGDSLIDSIDYILLRRYILGIISEFPAEDKENVEIKVQELINSMTLDEKIGQMVQPERICITAAEITEHCIGSVLSGGGSSPGGLEEWQEMNKNIQQAAALTRLGIPVIYGVDAVHGHNNVNDAVIFPHNIGLGAANDPELMKKIAHVTASEMISTGVNWNFAPCIAVAQDIRWGRTYESYSEDTKIVKNLAVPYIEGLQEYDIAATAKHFIADGGTQWGTGEGRGEIDQGDARISEEELRQIHLPAYREAVRSGVKTVMLSFSSWNGIKCHENSYLVNELLKGELGFEGFVVSDWEAVKQINKLTFEEQVITAVNSGIDMLMEPGDWAEVLDILKNAVHSGKITESRIDDAVSRILKVKFEIALFENPLGNKEMLTNELGSDAHREVAREAVRKSLVLLKNNNDLLPLSKDDRIYLTGSSADNIGNQCGGWTIFWQGSTGNIIEGSSIKSGIEEITTGRGRIVEDINQADVCIVVVGEEPYAERYGDDGELVLSRSDIRAIEEVSQTGKAVILILVSGRPMIITDELAKVDAFVAAWLPGTEGLGVAEVLFGDYEFTGKLPFTWPKSIEQLPININNLDGKEPLFPLGFGLETN